MPSGRFGQCARQRFRIVGQNAEIGHHGAEPLQQFAQQIAVGVIDGRAAARRAGFHHLIAGRKYRHLQPPPHLDLGDSERGGERDVLRLQHGAGRQRHLTSGHVLAGQPPIGAELQALRHDHMIAVHRHVFLHEHGIGARRHGRAGENPDGLAWLERDIRPRAGGQPAGDGKLAVAIGAQIGVAHGIAVDR